MSEIEKMQAIQKESQLIGEFLEWLENEKKITLAEYITEEIPSLATRTERKTYTQTIFQPVFIKTENLLAEFFHIDLKKVEMEKRALLKQIRSTMAKKNLES